MNSFHYQYNISLFLDQEYIFIVSLHEILLASNLFHPERICLDQVDIAFGLFDLVLIILFALLEFIQFSPVLKVQEQVVVVEKQHPHHKENSGQYKLVFENAEELH